MPQYKYTAVNQDSQRMTGSLSAADENAARKELNELGLAILSIEETTAPVTEEVAPKPEAAPAAAPTEPKPAQELKITSSTGEEAPKETPEAPATPPTTPQQPQTSTEPQKPEEQPATPNEPPKPDPQISEEDKKLAEKMLEKFEFEGIDKTGRKIIGTIPAKNKLSAYTRLVKEYQFEIKYIASNNASQAEKDHARQEGTQELATQMATSKDLTKAEAEKMEEVQDKGFKVKQEVLLKKVDYVLEKIKQVLQDFDKEIKPENKKIIQSYIDKLLRIKNSTNLEYIEHTVEELLKKIQDQEIFLHKEEIKKERTQLMIETQQMMSSLHAGGSTTSNIKGEIDKKLSKIRIPIIRNFIEKIQEQFEEPEQVTSLKAQIKAVNSQIFTYIKIWAKSFRDKEARSQVTASIQSIMKERKSLVNQLKELKGQKEKETKKAITPEKSADTLIASATNFLGWLLGFYLIYYFMAYYSAQKEISFGPSLPWNTDITNTPLIKYLVSIILLWYILLAIKTKFAPKKANLTPVIGVGGAVVTILILFNF